ncbi:putative ethanolamine kinase A-like protein, partial [Trifolium pratense]
VLCDRLKSPVLFSHNDLLSGNIMINHEEGHELGLMSPVFNVEELNRNALYLIDYEYASYNYRGFDIGNHFAEYAGFECDYSLYPNMNEQYHFFRHYLQPDRPHETENKLFAGVGNSAGVTLGLEFVGMVVATSVAVVPG